ncbi:hypothetical protein F5146DRAFT_487906 [Armillaria mellea]|nr:hypothetical protein F5146DRAFT_487906 [Armillaria mellea]
MQIYEALYRFIGDECALVYSHEFSPYGPGSVSTRTALTLPMDSLVIGKIPVSEPTKQAVRWRLNNNGHSTTFPMGSGSLTIHGLSVIQSHFLAVYPRTASTHKGYAKSRRMMYAGFAQTSRLSLSSSQNPRGIDRLLHNMKYVEVCERVQFYLQIMPCYDPFQLLDTFMADSEYTFALSLTVCEPCLDIQFNRISWPVIHWFCDINLSNEISVEEAEALFGIKVTVCADAHHYRVPEKPLSTIAEINTMCGFDPALEGADVCEYFGLPRMEIFENPVEFHPDREINQIALQAPVHDDKDTADIIPVTRIRADKEPSNSHAPNRLVVVLITLHIVLISLVIHLSAIMV